MANILPWRKEKKPQLAVWQEFVIGVGGSLGGLLAMRLYWQYVAPYLQSEEDERQTPLQSPPESASLDDVALVGKQYEEGESATAALGRIAYESLTGQAPDAQTQEQLSNLIHWLFGLIQGGFYGVLESAKREGGPLRGLLFGAGLWLFGDELTVPALGLQKGPTAVSPAGHINRLGAHLSFGLGTAISTRLLRALFTPAKDKR